MNKKFYVVIALMLTLALGAFGLAGTVSQENAPAKKEDPKEAKPQCLDCHGPYDKIAAATAKFTAASGETVTPHQYVPHADKKEIPECKECHLSHPVPLKSKDDVVKPKDVDWCYKSCHHMNNLQPCKTCH